MGDKERIAELEAQLVALAGEVERLEKDLAHDRHQWSLAVSDAEEARAEVAALKAQIDQQHEDLDHFLNGAADDLPRIAALRKDAERWQTEALAWRNGCTGRHGSQMPCVNVAALADKQEQT